MISAILHCHDSDDLYEVAIGGTNGLTIQYIRRYRNGLHREDLEYDECSEEVKNKILDEIEKELN